MSDSDYAPNTLPCVALLSTTRHLNIQSLESGKGIIFSVALTELRAVKAGKVWLSFLAETGTPYDCDKQSFDTTVNGAGSTPLTFEVPREVVDAAVGNTCTYNLAFQADGKNQTFRALQLTIVDVPFPELTIDKLQKGVLMADLNSGADIKFSQSITGVRWKGDVSPTILLETGAVIYRSEKASYREVSSETLDFGITASSVKAIADGQKKLLIASEWLLNASRHLYGPAQVVNAIDWGITEKPVE